MLGIGLIPVLFYTYNGVVGKSPDWINIAIFFIAAAITYTCEAIALYHGKMKCKRPWLAVTTLLALAALFVIFTFATPEIGIFKDPQAGTFGI